MSLRSKVNQEFQLYGDKEPPLHMTIETIRPSNDQDLRKATEIISNCCSKLGAIKLEVEGFYFFPQPHKAITLAVKNKGKLKTLSEKLYREFDKHKISHREFKKDWKLHISLAGTFGAVREWSEEEYHSAINFIKEFPADEFCEVEQLELWLPQFDPYLVVQQTFTLT